MSQEGEGIGLHSLDFSRQARMHFQTLDNDRGWHFFPLKGKPGQHGVFLLFALAEYLDCALALQRKLCDFTRGRKPNGWLHSEPPG